MLLRLDLEQGGLQERWSLVMLGGLMKQLMKEFEFSEHLVEAASVMQPHWAQ